MKDNQTYKSVEDDIRVRFKITRKLGEGGFAQVKHAKDRITNQKVAIKIYKKRNLSDKV